MNRFVLLIMLFTAASVAAQETPYHPDQLFSSDLIAWSQMQQPQAPEEHPGQKVPEGESAQPSQTSAASAAENQSPTAAEFTGIVTQDENGFVLKVSETTAYKLDNQRRAQQYLGQRVRVTGTMDGRLNVIHVDRIEPIS